MEPTSGSKQEVTQDFINQFVIASHFDVQKVKDLLPSYPELLDANAVWDERPIQAATHMGNLEIIGYLLEAGAPLDIFTASVLGMRERVEQFLADEPGLVNEPGVHNFPILYFPALAGQLEIAELLVARGAAINAGAGGNTPLHGAAGFGKLEMTEWLLKRGAEATAPGFENKTPLQMAEENGHTEIAALLRSYGA